MNRILSTNYSTKNVLVHLLEWRKNLDNNFVVGVSWTYLRDFDCFPNDLLIAKLEVYGSYDYLIITFSHIQITENNACE